MQTTDLLLTGQHFHPTFILPYFHPLPHSPFPILIPFSIPSFLLIPYFLPSLSLIHFYYYYFSPSTFLSTTAFHFLNAAQWLRRRSLQWCSRLIFNVIAAIRRSDELSANFPIFDEKNNAVHIVVVCCSPEKVRDKLCYKAGKVIKSIEIKDASKPKAAPPADKPKDAGDKPKAAAPPADKPKDAGDKPKAAPPADKPKGAGEKPKVVIVEPPKEPKVAVVAQEKPKADKPKSDGGPPPEKPKDAPKPQGQPVKIPDPAAAKAPPAGPPKGPEPVPANGVPSVFPYLGPSYDGYSAGPYYHGYGFPPPPPQPCYEGYYGYGPGQGYGYGHAYGRVGHPNGYFSEENPQGCFIM